MAMQWINGATTDRDLFMEVDPCFSKVELKYNKLVDVTPDGCPSLIGKNVGLMKQKQD